MRIILIFAHFRRLYFSAHFVLKIFYGTALLFQNIIYRIFDLAIF